MQNTILIIIVLFPLLAICQGATCGTGCSDCNNGTCLGCSLRYYFNASTSLCYSCVDSNCLICSPSTTICSTCIGTYAPRNNDSYCIECTNLTDVNCDSITHSCSSTGCAPCNQYAINGNNQCLACGEVYRNC